MNPALETLMLATGPIPDRALFLGAEPRPELAEWPAVTGWQPLKPKADAWQKAGFPRVDAPSGKWPLVMVLPGKSRDETLAWFAMADGLLEMGGTLVAAMPNTAGAGRFEKELAKATGGITSVQKHKCRAFSSVKSDAWDRSLFDEWRSLGERRKISGTDFVTEAGIFSADHVDPGSRLLAEHLPPSLHGDVADLGAGWGYLADAVLKRFHKIRSVDLYEADSRALECARLNLSAHERTIGLHWHDVTGGLPKNDYDAIIMNPPFHSGQATDVGLGHAFLRVAAASLRRGGKLLLVANRQLPYEAELTALGMPPRKLAEDNIYKILSAERR